MRTRRADMLSMRIDPELREAVKRRADAEQRSLSWYIADVLQKHIESTPEPKHKPRKS